MEVVALLYDFLRSGAVRTDALDPCDVRRSGKRRWAANEIDRAASEVPRARDATHSAVALRRAATAGDTEPRNGSHEHANVQSGVSIQPPAVRPVRLPTRRAQGRHYRVQVVRAVERGPRERCVSKALSV